MESHRSPTIVPGGQTEADEPFPDNYPFDLIRDLDIRGRAVRFRPIYPGDNYRMIMLYNTFSQQTIYHRFFSYVRIPESRVKRFTTIDYQRHVALVAEEEKDGLPRLMGVARYNTPKEETDTAEIAIVIGDPWQGQGVGTRLLRYLVDIAHGAGYVKLIGLVHYDNAAMPRVFRKLGVKYKKCDNGTEWRFEVFPGVPPDALAETMKIDT